MKSNSINSIMSITDYSLSGNLVDFEPLIFGYQRCQSITLNHGNRYTTIQWYDDFKVIAIHDEEGVVFYYNHNGHKGINIIDRIHYFGPTEPLSFLFYQADDFIIDVHDVVKKVLIDLVKTLKYQHQPSLP